MKIEKVSYQKTYSIGPYLTERIGFEASIGENESCLQAINALQAEADLIHKKNNPHLYQDSGMTPEDKLAMIKYQGLGVIGKPAIIDYKKKEALEITLANCTTLEQVRLLKEDCGKYGLLSEYVIKFNQLNNG